MHSIQQARAKVTQPVNARRRRAAVGYDGSFGGSSDIIIAIGVASTAAAHQAFLVRDSL